MPLTEAQKRANDKYIKANYEKVPFDIRRDSQFNGDVMRQHAAKNGESLNGFLKRAIEETIARDNAKG